MYTLFQTSEESRKKVLAEYNKTEEDLRRDVNYIQEWIKTQPHLPEIPDLKVVEYVLLCNKYSLENTKQKLDMYYTMHSQLNQIYAMNPQSPQIQATFDMMYIVFLPKLLDNLYRVMIIKHKDVPGDKFDQEYIMLNGLNSMEIKMREDFVLGDIVILDYEHLSMGHASKFTPQVAKLGVILFEKIYNSRIPAVHVINYPPIFNIILKVLSTIVKPKLMERIHLHPNMESLLKHIPLDILPTEYGGNEKSLDELQELWKLKFVQYKDRFDELGKLKVNGALRPVPMENIDIYGLQGSFKKIEID